MRATSEWVGIFGVAERRAAVTSTGGFFEEQTEQSEVKARIVDEYFGVWARVMQGVIERHGHESRIAYLDLFAGPGRYRNGAKSTPIRVLERAVADPWLRRSLVTVFNDKDTACVQDLQAAIDEVPGIETLSHSPEVRHGEVGEEMVKAFEEMSFVPTLFFVDPFGYKGLSLRLINSVLKDWGCDCIVFFNFNRINMGVNNIAVEPHMQALFGEDRVERLREAVEGLPAVRREEVVLNEIAAALMEIANGDVFVLPFRFIRADGARTSHYLIFVSKDIKGYKIMKDVMAKASDADDAGIPYFEHNPTANRQGVLFAVDRIDALADSLAHRFEGRVLAFEGLYEEHERVMLGTPYLEKHYRQALKRLEREHRIEGISVDPARKRRRFTYGPLTRIQFDSPLAASR